MQYVKNGQILRLGQIHWLCEPVVSRAYGEPDAKSFTLLGLVIEQPTKTLVSTHSTDTPLRRLAVNQFVVQSLMIPLAMVVGDEFRDSPSVMAFAERNHAVQTSKRAPAGKAGARDTASRPSAAQKER